MQFVSLIRLLLPSSTANAMGQEDQVFADKVIVLPRSLVGSGHPHRRIANSVRGFGHWLGRALRNHTTRRYLTEMDSRTLADLGISRAQAEFEASRWMWDTAPETTPR